MGKTLRERFRRGGWPRRLTIGAAASLVLFALIGFVVVPPIVKHLAEKQLSDLLGRKVEIARVRMNPFALSLSIEGFQIYEADAITSFVGFRRLYVNAQLSSVYRRAPVIKEISLESPRIRVVRLKATPDAWADTAAYNFSDILARLAARPSAPRPPPDPDAPAPRFSFNNIRLTDGAITFEDRPLGSRHEVTALAVGVPFVSTLPVYLDSFVEPGLSVRVDGTPFVLAGRTKPFTDSLETLLELRLDALDLTRYVPFVPLVLPFVVESARLTLALDLSFVRPRIDAPSLRLKGRVALDGLDVREKRPAGSLVSLVSLTKLDLELGDSDVTAQSFKVEKVLLSGLDVHLRRLRDGSFNLEHMLPVAPKPPSGTTSASTAAARPRPPRPHGPSAPPSATSSVGPRFSVAAFTLEKAAVHFRDETVSPAFLSEVRDIGVSVRGLSNSPGVSAQMKVGLRAVPGGVLTQEGVLRLTPLAASGTVTLSGIEPGRFGPYTRDMVAFDIVKGRLRLGARYLFEQPGKAAPPTVRINELGVTVSDLALRRSDAREDFFSLDELAVSGGALDLGRRTVTVDSIVTQDGHIRATRDGKGVVDLSTLVIPGAVAPAGAPSPPPPPPPPPPSSPPAVAADRAWTINLSRLDIERWGARFEDRAVSPPAILTVDPFALHVTNLSTAPGARPGVDLRMGINRTGKLNVTGNVGLDPQAANLRFDLRALEILPFQPYFRDQVGLTVTSGAVSVKGQLAMTMKVKTRAGASTSSPQVDLGADIGIAKLATVDRDKQEPLVKWSSLQVSGLRLFNHPSMGVAINEIALTDLDARLVLFPDGRFNLQEALSAPGASSGTGQQAERERKGQHQGNREDRAPPGSAPTTPSKEPAPQVSIGKVTLERGRVDYTDRVIKPGFTAEVTELGGHVSGLSSTAGTTADVDLRATVNRSGTLAITGKTNPLAKDLFVDAQIALKDVELPPASPYAGKFAGYMISKGKLDLALDYKVANRKLDAKNNLVLDQFTLGERVDSPDAVKAPVHLALALLKDRHGVIDIDLPISGSLDDPKFRVWPAILKVLGNLLVKAATAPFSLIASAFGGGDELSRVDFAPGAAALDANAQRKLRSLGKALQERPGLSLEIEGSSDPSQDREGLRQFVLERKLKAQKLTELVEAGAAVSSPEQIQLDPVERQRFLEKAYHAEKFAKPKNGLGLEKSLPPAEMEKLMLANTRVEDDDLRALAFRRATALQGGLARNGPSAAGRLFLVTPQLGPGGGHVELRLKKE